MTFALKLRSQHTTTGHDHPATSHAAAARVRPKSGTQRARVLEAITEAGAAGRTDDELVQSLGLSANSVRPRRKELEGAGLIRPAGTRPNAAGNDCTVWVAA